MQPAVVDTLNNSNAPTRTNFIIIQLSNCPLSLVRSGEHDETETSIRSREVHHQSHFIDVSNLTKNRIDDILVDIPWYSSNKYLATWSWRRSLPVRRWAKFSLTIHLDDSQTQFVLQIKNVLIHFHLVIKVEQ